MPNTNLGLLLGGSVERDYAGWVDDGVPVVARRVIRYLSRVLGVFGGNYRQ